MQKKRVISILLAGALALSAVPYTFAFAEESAEEADGADYDAVSEEIYYDVLGEYYDLYEAADALENVSERYANFAIAEAKLLESGVTIPTTYYGGSYAIGRVATGTVSSVLYGADLYRYQNIVVTNELITKEDRTAMKEKWSELKGTGEYRDWAVSYLEEQGYTLSDTYARNYSADPSSWDILAYWLTTVMEPLSSTVDGLIEYDVENTIQPALAESWDVSEDGLTYTFHLREGVKWVDSQGRELGEVTADDFVAGMQHLLDAQSGMESMVQGVLVNATEYIYGDITDFSQVGVTAVDDYTVEYTLEAPCSYFMSLLTQPVFFPMNRSYYESQGGKFGTEYDASASDYTYGKTQDNIAYCGPFIVTSATETNQITFEQNETYWNKDSMKITTMKWIYNDGTDTTKSYTDLLDNTISVAGLNSSTLELAKADGNFDKYVYTTGSDGTTYQLFFNLNRAAYANTNDSTKVVSPQTDEDKERTSAAVKNQHFRLAVCYAFDRGAYNAQKVGEDLKYVSLRNSIVPGTFVSLEEEVTVDINGTEVTYPAGTYYGEILQAQLDADGYPIQVWDPEGDDGIGSGDGFDGWYNAENAAAELELAIAELAEEGIVIDEENPIYLDYAYVSSVSSLANSGNAIKQSIESALGGKVIVNLVDASDLDAWYYTAYYAYYGYESNYDISDVSGWAADYSDPTSYLSTMLPDYDGYNTKMLGLY